MFASTALDGGGGGAGGDGGMTPDGVALRLQRPSDANSPMDSACCGGGGNGVANANNRTPATRKRHINSIQVGESPSMIS